MVRQTDGSPLAVPGWMTDPEAAYVNVVSTARLPLGVLRELRRVAVTYWSSSGKRLRITRFGRAKGALGEFVLKIDCVRQWTVN